MSIQLRCQNPSHQTNSGDLDIGQNLLKSPPVLDFIRTHIKHLHPITRKATFDLLSSDGETNGQIVFDNDGVTFRSERDSIFEGAIHTVRS